MAWCGQHTSLAAVRASISFVVTLVVWSLLICGASVTAWLTGVSRGSLRCTGPLCEVASLPRASADQAVAGGRSLLSLVILACMTLAFTIGAAPGSGGSGGSLLVAAAAVAGAVAVVLLALLVTASVVLLIVRLLAGSRHRRGISQKMSAPRRTT